MKQFRYEAKRGKDLVKGILASESKDAAIDKINAMGLVPVELCEERSDGRTSRVLGGEGHSSLGGASHAMAVFYRQLGRLLRSGVPLLPALVLVAEQSDDRRLQPVLEEIKSQVRQGRALSEAMAAFPSLFSDFSIAMAELGENTGQLHEALGRLADCSEKQNAVSQKVRNALAYPALVSILGALAFIFLVSYVVPKFSRLFEDLGQTLPFLTRILIALSDVFHRYGLGLLLAVAGLALFFRQRLSNPAVRVSWDRMKMKIPLIGKLIFMTQFAVFSRSMEILLKGGVPLLRALRTGIPAVSNKAMRQDLQTVERRVEQGAALSESLKSFGTFPIFAVHLLLIGEQTGRLEQSFSDIADWYEQEVDEHTRAVTQLLEPLTILVIGIALGFVAIAILLPVFSMDAIIS